MTRILLPGTSKNTATRRRNPGNFFGLGQSARTGRVGVEQAMALAANRAKAFSQMARTSIGSKGRL